MRIEDATKARVFTIFGAPKLDPITVTLQDVAPGHGRLIVECCGEAWAAYWGGMGNETLAEFVSSCGTDYITGKLTRDRMLKRDVAYLERIVVAVQEALRSNSELDRIRLFRKSICMQ